MKAAVVTSLGQLPVCMDFADPLPEGNEVLVDLRAAAISPLARARASGKHYSFDGQYPFVAGVDGIGTLSTGQRVYFALPRSPFGAMAEHVPVQKDLCAPVPDDLDDVRAAALANPGMSSWVALRERARMQPGETVLVNGATGTSGQLAVQIARHMGARRVVATGRNPAALDRLKALGADEVITLSDAATVPERLDAVFAQGVDIVLDYLWGSSARMILEAAAHARPPEARRRFVQIGSISGEELALPGSWLRSSALELIGSGIGSVSMAGMMSAIGDLLAAADAAGLEIATETCPLAAISEAWADTQTLARQVITIG